MHPRLQELVERLERERAGVLEAADGLPREQWPRRPAADRWSVCEVALHLHRVEGGVARLIAKRAAQARAAGHPAERETGSVLGALDGRRVAERAPALVAPAQVSPDDPPDADGAVRILAESRRALLESIASADGLALGAIKHTHPVLGEIDLYQWLLFVAQHEARHREQIQEIAGQIAAGA